MINLQPGEDVTCTFTNTAEPGSITIVKEVVGQVPGSDWDYTGDLDVFTLPAAGGQTTFDPLAAGDYTVNETAKTGYSQAVVCDSGETGMGSVTVSLQPGEDVICTFTNTADPGSITIVKEVVGQVPGSDWDYTGDLGAFSTSGGRRQRAVHRAGSGRLHGQRNRQDRLLAGRRLRQRREWHGQRNRQPAAGRGRHLHLHQYGRSGQYHHRQGSRRADTGGRLGLHRRSGCVQPSGSRWPDSLRPAGSGRLHGQRNSQGRLLAGGHLRQRREWHGQRDCQPAAR